MSYKRAGSILNWSGHGSFGSLSFSRWTVSGRPDPFVLFLFFFFFPPLRGPRSIGIDPVALAVNRSCDGRCVVDRAVCVDPLEGEGKERRRKRIVPRNEARLNARSAIDRQPKERTRTRGGIPGDRLAASGSGVRARKCFCLRILSSFSTFVRVIVIFN